MKKVLVVNDAHNIECCVTSASTEKGYIKKATDIWKYRGKAVVNIRVFEEDCCIFKAENIDIT